MNAALHQLLRYVLPNVCVSCETPMPSRDPDGLVCGVCRTRWRTVPAGCDRCGQPAVPVGPCRFCRDWPAALRWVRSAVWLGEEARAVVHHLKYEGYTAVADTVGERMSRIPHPASVTLVPVPLAPARARARGYNQAASIAEVLAARWRMPLDATLLTRVRSTRSQTDLPPDARQANVQGAFSAVAPSHVASSGDASRIILVDDVLTTGATVAAAAQALQDAGWCWIGAVTFARATPYAVRGMLDAATVLAS